MDPHRPASAAFVLPHYQPDEQQPILDGFEGLNTLQRAQRAEILCRAYSLWDCKGRPDNSQLADWLEAEAQVLGEA